MTTAQDSIPIIDLQESKHVLLPQLRHAMTDIGFFYAKNIGLSQDVIKGLIHLLPDLFGISHNQKSQIELENSPHFLGYSAVGSETTAGKADNREQFEFASQPRNHEPGSSRPLYENLFGPNQYPTSLPEARSIIDNYIATLSNHADRLTALMAEALGLSENAFEPFLSGSNRLKIVRYPGSPNGEVLQGVGPHKDASGLLTVLLQASPPHVKGLQVLTKSGSWIDVPNIPDTFVVNMGQLFEVLTLGTCKATTHRVLGSSNERFSVPMFVGARLDLTKGEAVEAFSTHFRQQGQESAEGAQIDSPFLLGKYNTWGESQLRSKIRSHREAGKRFYPEVYDRYINES